MPAPDNTKLVEELPVREFYEEHKEKLQLELVAGEEGLDRMIREKSINRPALALTGFFTHFAFKRLQLIGAGEMAYLKNLKKAEQKEILKKLIQYKIPAIVISRKLKAPTMLINLANDHGVPLFRSPMKSKDFTAEATILLEDSFAPRTTIHGTMMDIKGIGTLIRGKSGVGKSECALALIERGHSLVADDHAYIKRVYETELLATSSELNRGYMECRGIGIINITHLFGIRSIRMAKRIDLVVSFVEWHPNLVEERTGLEQNFYNILGIDIPHMEIPVRPGRDMARLVEVASMVMALKMAGYDSAAEFNNHLIEYMNKM